jgi:uncharacterized membrane protein YraQ (UPF0718 family)
MVGSLAAAGVSTVPLIAFLFASPLLNPNLFVFTGLAMGWDWALVRAAGALILGTSGGLLASRSSARGRSNGWLRVEPAGESQPSSEPAEDRHLSPWVFARNSIIEGRRVLSFAWRHFLLAMILSAWVVAYLPRDWVSTGFGQGRWWGVPAAVLFGVPGYFCGGGAVPLVHGLLAHGLSRGAALAFFLAGSATTARNLAALGTVTGRRGLVVFLALTQGGAIILGWLLDLVG